MPAIYLRYLKALKQSKSTGGFTLAELLIVVIIIGILAAVALPSFLNQAAKARQVGAKTTIGEVNNAQSIYRSENNTFAPNMKTLALGLPLTTATYNFEISGETDTATITATSKDSAVKGYSGGAVRYGAAGTSAVATVICEAKIPSVAKPAPPVLDPSQETPELAAQCDSATQDKL